jgi:outer membrane protein assembly factor BamA
LGEGTAYSPWRSLRPRWWFPVVDSTTVGFTTSGGDVLARHTYQATITNRTNSILYSYDRFYPTVSLLASRYEDSVDHEKYDRRLLGQITVPWRKVQWRVSGSAALIHDEIPGAALQGFRLGAFFNNAHEYLFSISPERGVTASIDYENLSRTLGSDRSLQEIRGDVRGYLTIPCARSPLGHHVLAVRAAGGRNFGDFVLQRHLKVGGDSTGELSSLDLTEFPVRGFETKTLRGRSAAIGSVEYRFPLYEIERGPTTWPLFFNRIHGDVFSDAGRAGGQTIASAGAEAAADFIIANGIAIRYRVGVAWRLTKPGKGDVQPYISFGTSF